MKLIPLFSATAITLVMAGGALAQVDALDLVEPIADYKIFVTERTAELVEGVDAFVAAVKAGDVDKAKALYPAVRVPYEQIEPIAELFSDLDVAIDSRADDYEQAEADPEFPGFHRIEYGLWGQGTVDGLVPVAEKLAADTAVLKDRLRALKLQPEDLAGTAERQARRLGEGQVRDGENRWAFSDPAELEANLDGMEKSVLLLRPLVADAAPEVAAAIDAGLAAARAALAELKAGDAYPAYDTIGAEARDRLAEAFRALAEAISALNPAIGLG